MPDSTRISVSELRRRMGEAGRRKIERHYTWDTKIDRILDFYRQALRSKAPV